MSSQVAFSNHLKFQSTSSSRLSPATSCFDRRSKKGDWPPPMPLLSCPSSTAKTTTATPQRHTWNTNHVVFLYLSSNCLSHTPACTHLHKLTLTHPHAHIHTHSYSHTRTHLHTLTLTHTLPQSSFLSSFYHLLTPTWGRYHKLFPELSETLAGCSLLLTRILIFVSTLRTAIDQSPASFPYGSLSLQSCNYTSSNRFVGLVLTLPITIENTVSQSLLAVLVSLFLLLCDCFFIGLHLLSCPFTLSP